MASTDARPIPRKNVAYRVTFPIMDADGDLVTGAAGLDSEVSKDGGTFADCGSEATEIATSSGMYFLDLTSTEMNADTVAIIVKTSTSGAKTTAIVLYPEEAGDVRADVVQWNGTAVATPATAGYPAVTLKVGTGTGEVNLSGGKAPATLAAGDIANNAITAASIAADAITDAKVASDVTIASVTGAVGSVSGAVGSVTGNVGGNVVGTVASVVGAVGSVTGNVGGNVTGSVGSIASGGITTASFAAGAVDAAAIAANAIGSSELASTAVDKIIVAILANVLTDGTPFAGASIAAIKSVTDKLDDTLEDDGGTQRFTANALEEAPSGTGASAASIRAEIDANSTQLAAIVADTNELQTDWVNGGRLDLLLDGVRAKTDTIPASPAAVGDIPTAVQNADALLARNEAGGSSTGRTVGEAIARLRNRVVVSGGIMTVYAEDGVTPLWTAPVTTTPGDPISEVAPT
jgi:hypothetical protein